MVGSGEMLPALFQDWSQGSICTPASLNLGNYILNSPFALSPGERMLAGAAAVSLECSEAKAGARTTANARTTAGARRTANARTTAGPSTYHPSDEDLSPGAPMLTTPKLRYVWGPFRSG